jgi:microcystin degradation protein MlrC
VLHTNDDLGRTRRPRVLVGAFAMEANTFAPGSTTLADFRAQVWRVGRQVGPDALGPMSELAAAWRVLEERGYEIVPSVAAWSAPRQPLAPEVLDAVTRAVTEACDPPVDGAYLMLHGSAVAHGEDDPEGVLLGALRTRLGPGRPIAISLDCHANLTPAMVAAVDAVSAYRTCPHVDTRRTGEQAARLLAGALEGRLRPVVAMATRPMITPPQLHDSGREPFRTLMARCAELERDGVLAAALLPVQPWIDAEGLSWKAVVTADGDVARARAVAEQIIADAWTVRREMLAEPAPRIDEALAAALAAEPPVVLADAGDATNGGAVGDSTELLRAALRKGSGRILLSVMDPAAAQAAYRAGPGAVVAVDVGSGGAGDYNERTSLVATVQRVFDGSFAYTHPVNAGYRASTGAAALVRSAAADIVLHSRSVGVIDPALYETLGADPRAYDVVQAKSHVSHRAGFARVSERTIVAGTGGPTTADLRSLDYARRPRPLFPFELG